jgi:hypothetical protein
MSRRAWLISLGGGVASVSLAFGLWKYTPRIVVHDQYPVMTGNVHVDYSGWIVTPADKKKLTVTGSLHRFENTALAGEDLFGRTMASAEACETWCLQEPDCQGFSYASAEHPDANRRRVCSLKDTNKLTPSPDPLFTSGIR